MLYGVPTSANREPRDAYRRRVLHVSAARELMLATWTPGIRCAPHDHAGATGVVWLLSGSLVERRFRFDGATLDLIETLAHRAPARIVVGPTLIHDMIAPHGARSLHHYRPTTDGMRLFLPARRETWTLRGDVGAFEPADPAYVVHVDTWERAA